MVNATGCIRQIAVELEAGDYEQNGLIYCGKCRTPRQIRIDLGYGEQIVNMLCKCRSDAREEEKQRDRERERRERIASLKRTGVTDGRYVQMRFERSDGDLTFARQYVKNWETFERDNVGLMILGDTGTGKTYAAACIANALLDQGVSVYMANIMRMCDKMTSLFDKDRLRYIDSLQGTRLLVLDDLGAERGSDFVQEQVYNIIETRYRSGRPLIITSNLTLEQLRSCDSLKYARTYDRLKEMCHPVVLEGGSRRREIANKRSKAVTAILSGG